jgi:hypothetical protein
MVTASSMIDVKNKNWIAWRDKRHLDTSHSKHTEFTHVRPETEKEAAPQDRRPPRPCRPTLTEQETTQLFFALKIVYKIYVLDILFTSLNNQTGPTFRKLSCYWLFGNLVDTFIQSN